MSRRPVTVRFRNRKKEIPPMHQVYFKRTPEVFTFTGCRCRKTFPRTAKAGLRSVLGTPTRKIERHTCDLEMYSCKSFILLMGSPPSSPCRGGCIRLNL